MSLFITINKNKRRTKNENMKEHGKTWNEKIYIYIHV